MASPLYPTFEKRIDDATRRIIDDQVTPWAFLKSGKEFSIKTFGGKDIAYITSDFTDVHRQIFWGRYIHDFLEALAVEQISLAVELAAQRKVDLKVLLPEIEGLLLSAANKTFQRMADIDRRLRGNGFPENVSEKSIEGEINQIREFVSRRISSELEMWKPKSRLEEWHERNKFLAWIINTLIAVTGLLAALTSLGLKYLESNG